MYAKNKILKAFSLLLIVGLMLALLPAGTVMANGTVNDRETAINLAADKLVDNQNVDGGFAWKLTDPASAPSTNVLGITALGILKAHELNDKAAYETAIANAYAYVVNNPPAYSWDGSKYIESTKGVDSFPDITFLIGLAEAAASDSTLLTAINDLQDPDITAADIANLAKTRWDNMILFKGSTQEIPANGTATSMVQRVRDDRHAQGYDALIPWDLEAAVTAALALHTYFPSDGYDVQASDITAVIYASTDDGTYFNSDDDTQDEYLVGLTGAIEAFSKLNIYPEKAAELTVKLLNLQQTDGSWNYYGETPVAMSVQSTAYAVMALVEEGSEDAVIAARKGADWLVKNQKSDGGWYSEGGAGDEFPEIDSEAAWALAVAQAPVTIGAKGYYSIQSAIDAAVDGETINIAGGTYIEHATNGTVSPETLGKLINFVGETDVDGKPLSVIKGSLMISLDSGMNDNVSVRNIHFVATTASTLSLFGINGITIENCTFDGNDLFTNGYIGVQLNSGSSNGNSNATITNSTFKDGLYGGIQGYVDNITVENCKFYNIKSGINHQGGGNLVMTNNDISVEAQAVGSDTYGIRFAGSATQNLTVTGGSFAVDKNGLTADAGTYHSAIIIRAAATGTLEVNGASIYGEVVNLSDTLLDATGNWWGSASGPAAGQIIEDEDLGDVSVCPWLDAEGGNAKYPVNNTTTPAGFCTIKAAIEAASDGDTINVSAGTYDEENISITKGLILQGAGAATTFITPSTVTNNSTIVVNNPSGDVTIDGFTFNMQPKPNYGSAIVVTGTSIGVDSATVTISNNVVNGSDDGTKSDYGFYGQGNNARLIITDNVISKTGDNPICMENQHGSTTVSNNTITVTSELDYSPYFSMAHSGTNVTTPQIVDGNTFYLDNSVSGAPKAITFNTAVLNAWQGKTDDTGYYTDIQITDNIINTGGAYASGIGIFDKSSTDGYGTISGADITGNQIIGENKTDVETYGIILSGDIKNTLIQDNIISNLNMGIWLSSGLNSVYPSVTDINDNKITPVGTPVKNDASVAVDASPNWWGSPCGPTNLVGEVDYDPWYLDESMTTTASASVYVLPSGTTTEDMNAVLACALPDATITFEGGTYPGGLVVDNDDLTFNLNGATVGAGSPAFTINGDNITIQGPGTLDGNGSADPGILVNAGADNFILDGVEVTEWADGVQVAGAVESLKIVNNWIDNNTDAGLQIDADPTGIVTIVGNLFKANGGNGVSNGGSSLLNTEYNSWGDLVGPAGPNGDGVGANVDADPFTFVEFFMDVDPDSGALLRNVDESASFNVKLKADAANLYGLSFKLTYDDAKLQLNSQTFSAPWYERCTALDSGAGELAYRCNLISAAWSADEGSILTLNFTATGSDLTGNGPWDALFDISQLVADTSAGAYGGAKVYVNNAGFGDPSVTERDITDTDDGKVTIRGIAQFTGFIDLQGRANDSGATLAIYNQQVKSGSTLLANATSSSGGGYATSYVSTNILTVGTEYWLVADAWLYLPTTMTSAADWANSDTLTTRPKTELANLVLLGGDATNDDEIGVLDASCIGGNYNETGSACGTSTGWSDVNGDGAVDILDLVMMGTNYDLKYSPWTP